jgi:hypothetical protein
MNKTVDKLMARVKKLPGHNSCWLWAGPLNRPNGYGWIYLEGKDWSTHRAAYNFLVGKIPPGKCVLHKCDVKNCVRPSHLYIGTKGDNARDAVRRGGMARGARVRVSHAPPGFRFFIRDWSRKHGYCKGEAQGNSKLTEQQVRKIRSAYPAKNTYELAREFGVQSETIRGIIRRVSWKHVK